MKYRSLKCHELDLDGMTAALSLQPSPVMDYVDPVIARRAGLIAVGYLIDDHDASNPLEECDGMGHIHSAHRHSGQHAAMQTALGLDSDWAPDQSLVERQAEKALMELVSREFKAELVAFIIESASKGMSRDEAIGHFMNDFTGQLPACQETWLTEKVREKTSWRALLEKAWREGRTEGSVGNPYAVVLDCYEHGGQVWSLTGQGMQCPFDTASGAGVWVPDEYLHEELDAIRDWEGLDAARIQAARFAGQALESYNAWLAGECYGIAVDVYSVEAGQLELIDDLSVYGHVGRKRAEEALAQEVQGMLDGASLKAA